MHQRVFSGLKAAPEVHASPCARMHVYSCQADLPLEEMWSIENRSGRRTQFSGGIEMDATTAVYLLFSPSLSISLSLYSLSLSLSSVIVPIATE